MSNNLLVKDVPFHDAMLRATQDENGQIWVGVRWICEGIGMTPGQMQNERRRIHNDLVLYVAERNFVLPTSSGDQEVMCLKLEFLPLWLAKISITPRMKEEKPELVEKLITYQLKAKDVLAAAFLSQTRSVSKRETAITPIEKFFDRQNEILERQTEMMNSFCSQILAIIQGGTKFDSPQKTPPAEEVPVIRQNWKKYAYSLIDQVIESNPRYASCERRHVLYYVYSYMNVNYGIIWAQEEKEYHEKHSGIFHTIDIIEDNLMYRSIFEAIVKDLIQGHESRPVRTELVQKLITPLVMEMKDQSAHNNMRAYKKVFKLMKNKYGVDWTARTEEYKANHSYDKTPVTKTKVVNSSKELLEIFKKATLELCERIERGDSIE